jgi:hypothetical protein
MAVMRIALASNLLIEFEADYVPRLYQRARRGDSPEVMNASRVWSDVANEPRHSDWDPDLREKKARDVDWFLLPGEVHGGLNGLTYVGAASQYPGRSQACRRCLRPLIPAAI